MKKIIISGLLILSLILLCCCGSKEDKKVYKIGICQLVQHNALDQATAGFIDAIGAYLGEENVEFIVNNASGDSNNCAIICNGFVNDGVDLIMANATLALQAAASATSDIPILGTSVSDYATALNINNYTGILGNNISGTSDISPLEEQAKMIPELFPKARTVGILYCSGEANSVYQANKVEVYLESVGIKVEEYTFSYSVDVALVTEMACDEVDVLFIPTDNTAASCGSSIGEIANKKNIPIITGEESLCKAVDGIATLSIDYYHLGAMTGEMAYEILINNQDISKMPIRVSDIAVRKINLKQAEKYKVDAPLYYSDLDLN